MLTSTQIVALVCSVSDSDCDDRWVQVDCLRARLTEANTALKLVFELEKQTKAGTREESVARGRLDAVKLYASRLTDKLSDAETVAREFCHQSVCGKVLALLDT
jgi:hypothetical protein